MINIGNDWDEILKDVFDSEIYAGVREFLKEEYRRYRVYPSMYDIFNSLKHTPYAAVKAVLLGQDPYHGPGQAHGMCFSVKEGVSPPPSLVNIYRELHDDLGLPVPQSGNLTKWADQGVLLLNTSLTVREHCPNSHKDCGWTWVTDRIIEKIDQKDSPVVFLLWGSNARSKKLLVKNPKHLILECAHPSPFSASGFFGCRHFSKTNAFLERNGLSPIDWDLTTP